jgi:hypothetical protein
VRWVRWAAPSVVAVRRKTNRLFDAGFSFEKLGIGGLNKEFSEIFRRAFASRLYPSLMREMGMNHVRGMLLYGAPGCGKTLIARKIGQALHAKEPKVGAPAPAVSHPWIPPPLWRLWVGGCGPAAVGLRLWAGGCGLAAVGRRLWVCGCGLAAVGWRLWAGGCGLWVVESPPGLLA